MNRQRYGSDVVQVIIDELNERRKKLNMPEMFETLVNVIFEVFWMSFEAQNFPKSC